MKKMKRTLFILFVIVLVMGGCRKRPGDRQDAPREDVAAKKMLQGIWVNEDEEDVAFMAKGDTIFYPDSTSQPVYFQIFNDTLVLHGANDVKYPIVKQAAHLFEFKNQNGDVVKLTLSDNPYDKYVFASNAKRPQALNQNQLIKRDSVISFEGEKYHSYVQVNPTTYKVVKASYNDEGVEVDNVYYDNIIHISLYKGAEKVFSRDFHKQDFARQVPKDFLRQGILNDILLVKADAAGVHYNTMIGIPDSPSSYVVETIISYKGKLTLKLAN